MGWSRSHEHIWVYQPAVRWVVQDVVFIAACCACGKAGWKLAPGQEPVR